MPDQWLTQMRKGLAELCVLAALRHDEAYGYAILKRLSGAGSLAFTESTVYPVLARLAEEGHLFERAVASPDGPVRRYFRLTARGRRRLAELESYWRLLAGDVDSYLRSE